MALKMKRGKTRRLDYGIECVGMMDSMYIRFFTFPILLVICAFSFVGYALWSEHIENKLLVEQALTGNAAAIQILGKYEKPQNLDKRIVGAALEGNVNALKILDLYLPEQKNPHSS